MHIIQKSLCLKASLFLLGISFTIVIALLGYLFAVLPGFNQVGPLACAILLAVFYRQLFGYPHLIQFGIQFSAKYLLRFAIILYGLKLHIGVIWEDGLGLLLKGILVICLSIFIIMYLAKKFQADKQLSLLLGVGTGVCGAAAIAAVSPILQTKEEDTAIGIGIIAFIGTIFSIIYTVLQPFLPLTDIQYGIWSGISLHELAHVALAAEPAGENALTIALLAKLSRVFLLVPLCFIFIFFIRRRKQKEESTSVPFPYFLLGFVAMSLFGSYILGSYIPTNTFIMDKIGQMTTFILTTAMVGLGLNVSFKDVREKALGPLIIMIITSLLISIIMYITVSS